MCNFLFFFAAYIVNSFNFISNVIYFAIELKYWFEVHKEVFSGGFSNETCVNFTIWWYLDFKKCVWQWSFYFAIN